MKKILALIFALLFLTACGAASEPAEQTQPKTTTPVETVPVETEPEPTMSPEGYFVEEITKDNGTKVIRHRLGNIKGKVIWSRTENPNGTFEEKTNDHNGKLLSEKYSDTDGVIYEKHYYDYGSIRISITQFPDGSGSEIHHDADGFKDGPVDHPGTIVYKKNVTADGQVTEEGTPLPEIIYESDGTFWEIRKEADGSVYKSHYTKDWIQIEGSAENPNEGWTIVFECYENGMMKKRDWTYTDSPKCFHTEYYENGLTKTAFNVHEDGTEIEEQCTEEGYYTYYRRKDQYGQREYFAGENNELVKYIEEGTVYEGDAITDNQRNTFKQLQDMAAETAYNILNGI